MPQAGINDDYEEVKQSKQKELPEETKQWLENLLTDADFNFPSVFRKGAEAMYWKMQEDHKEVFADRDKLVREIDVVLNGEAGAAKQASLCDLVGDIKKLKSDLDRLIGNDLKQEKEIEGLMEQVREYRFALDRIFVLKENAINTPDLFNCLSEISKSKTLLDKYPQP